MIAAKLATLKQGRPGHDGKEVNLPLSLAETAKLLNVSVSGIQAASIVREQATPEMVQAVEEA